MPQTEQPADNLRAVTLAKIGPRRYEATNQRGGRIVVGDSTDESFNPVELLLAALGACGALDMEALTHRHADYDHFAMRSEGRVVRDDEGSHVVDLQVAFDLLFPPGPGGTAARELVPSALQRIEEKLCTVGRTVALGEPVRYRATTQD